MANGTTDYSLGMLATKPNCSSYFCLLPKLQDMTVSAIKAADFVLIPVQPSALDIWAAEDLVELIKA